jgi:hypothetical protein
MTDWEQDRDRLDLPLGGDGEVRRRGGVGEGPGEWEGDEELPEEGWDGEPGGAAEETWAERRSPRPAWILLGLLALGVLLALAVLVGYRLPRPEPSEPVAAVRPLPEDAEPAVPVRPLPEDVEPVTPVRPEERRSDLPPRPPPETLPVAPAPSPVPEPPQPAPPPGPAPAPAPGGEPTSPPPEPAPQPPPEPAPPPPPPPPAAIAAEPGSLDFGEAGLGAAGEARAVVFRNSGGSPARIDDLALAGADPAAFAIVQDRCRGAELGPGESCAVGLVFRPREEGLQRARLELRSRDLDEPPRVALAGAGAAARLRVSPRELAFGEVRLGASVERQVTLSNAGRAPALLRGFAVSGAAARELAMAADGCPETDSLAPGESCELTIRFAPLEEGEREATLMIRHGGAGAIEEVALRGTALPAPAPRIALSPGALRFPGQRVGGRSDIETVTIANRGSARLTLGEPRIEGRDADDFQIVPGSCAGAGYLVPGSECTVGIRFAPSAPGGRQARLVVPHDAEGGRAAVALAGLGES